jgi:hypothetical protein
VSLYERAVEVLLDTTNAGLGIVPLMIASERGAKPATTSGQAMPIWNRRPEGISTIMQSEDTLHS